MSLSRRHRWIREVVPRRMCARNVLISAPLPMRFVPIPRIHRRPGNRDSVLRKLHWTNKNSLKLPDVLQGTCKTMGFMLDMILLSVCTSIILLANPFATLYQGRLNRQDCLSIGNLRFSHGIVDRVRYTWGSLRLSLTVFLPNIPTPWNSHMLSSATNTTATQRPLSSVEIPDAAISRP